MESVIDLAFPVRQHVDKFSRDVSQRNLNDHIRLLWRGPDDANQAFPWLIEVHDRNDFPRSIWLSDDWHADNAELVVKPEAFTALAKRVAGCSVDEVEFRG